MTKSDIRISNKVYWRHRWSHLNPIHQFLVRWYNRVLGLVPFSIKYGIGKRLRGGRPPYCLIGKGSRVVQVGAPRDTLAAGRSRAVYFCLRAGPTGRVIIVEPDPDNTGELQRELDKRRIGQASIHTCAAWSEKATLRLRVNPKHPATNFTEGCADYSAEDLEAFQLQEVEADSLDNILAREGIDGVDLVSITTNGAEIEILRGLGSTLGRNGVSYVAVARTGERAEFEGFLNELGFAFLTYDDRGFTFRRIEPPPPA